MPRQLVCLVVIGDKRSSQLETVAKWPAAHWSHCPGVNQLVYIEFHHLQIFWSFLPFSSAVDDNSVMAKWLIANLHGGEKIAHQVMHGADCGAFSCLPLVSWWSTISPSGSPIHKSNRPEVPEFHRFGCQPVFLVVRVGSTEKILETRLKYHPQVETLKTKLILSEH